MTAIWQEENCLQQKEKNKWREHKDLLRLVCSFNINFFDNIYYATPTVHLSSSLT